MYGLIHYFENTQMYVVLQLQVSDLSDYAINIFQFYKSIFERIFFRFANPQYLSIANLLDLLFVLFRYCS